MESGWESYESALNACLDCLPQLLRLTPDTSESSNIIIHFVEFPNMKNGGRNYNTTQLNISCRLMTMRLFLPCAL